MADDKNIEALDGKKKLPVLPILIGVLLVIVVAAGAVFITLLMTGAFSDSELQAELNNIEQQQDIDPFAVAAAAAATPATLMVTPNPSRLQTLYYEMARPLTANLAGSRKVMQVTLAVMTHYDQMVVNNIQKHELSIRSALLTVLGNTREEDLLDPAYKEVMAEQLRLTINSVLERHENFGGVESVYFSEFLVQ
jgi:flagellar FliL protein